METWPEPLRNYPCALRSLALPPITPTWPSNCPSPVALVYIF